MDGAPGKSYLTAQLDSIEQIGTIDEAVFLPTADATPKRIIVSIVGGVMVGRLVKMVQPDYPLFAMDSGITGIVVLQATIGKDGHVENLHVLSGPSALQQAAMDAVKKWIYRPYLLNNEPVAVDTTINVNFTLNGHR